jgi:hypothetical protein
MKDRGTDQHAGDRGSEKGGAKMRSTAREGESYGTLEAVHMFFASSLQHVKVVRGI